mgnify:CR=1 FL=1
MKKLFGTMAVAAALFAGYSAYNRQHSNELTDIALVNVEALASEGDNMADTGDTGPGENVDCGGWNTGTKKECMCRNSHPCTPTSCK